MLVVDLQDFAVVGKDAVYFLLHIGDLCVDASPKTFGILQGLQSERVLIEAFCIVITIAHLCVGLLTSGPEVSFNHQGDSSVFSADIDAVIATVGLSVRRGIAMCISNVANLEVCPSGSSIHEASVVGIGVANNEVAPYSMIRSCIRVLSPSFIIGHPDSNTRVLLQCCDNMQALIVEVLLNLLFRADASAGTSTGHILPDDESVAVAPFIPKVVLNLDMLTNHIHAQRLDCLQVIDHGFVGGRSQ